MSRQVGNEPKMCVLVKMHNFRLPADWVLKTWPTTLSKTSWAEKANVLMLSLYFACTFLHPRRSVLSCSARLHHDWCTQRVIVGLVWDKQSTAACSFPLILMSMYAPTSKTEEVLLLPAFTEYMQTRKQESTQLNQCGTHSSPLFFLKTP